MRNQVLLKRYTQGLVSALQSPDEFAAAQHDLQSFSGILASSPRLRDSLTMPFLPVAKKKDIAAAVFKKAGFSPKGARFLLLLVEHGRLSLLPDIAAHLPIAWNEEQGITTFEVSSVVPLNDPQRKLLSDKLAALEKRPVSLRYKLDPSLIGGLSIRKGNIVYDISIDGSLNRLKENLKGEGWEGENASKSKNSAKTPKTPKSATSKSQ